MKSRPNSWRGVLAACASLAAVAGCADLPIISYAYYDIGYMPAEYRRELPVVVRGNPFAAPQATTDQAVADDLRGTGYGGVTTFVVAPAGPAPVYRLVVMFNQPVALGAFGLCVRPQPSDAAFGAAPAARVGFLAALCRGDKAINYTEGSLAVGSGPASPAFRDGIVQIGLTLLPAYNPAEPGGDAFPD